MLCLITLFTAENTFLLFLWIKLSRGPVMSSRKIPFSHPILHKIMNDIYLTNNITNDVLNNKNII